MAKCAQQSSFAMHKFVMRNGEKRTTKALSCAFLPISRSGGFLRGFMRTKRNHVLPHPIKRAILVFLGKISGGAKRL
jgi:hypothetical protein